VQLSASAGEKVVVPKLGLLPVQRAAKRSVALRLLEFGAARCVLPARKVLPSQVLGRC